MDIRTSPIDSCGLTAVEVNSGTPEAWYFLPFENFPAKMHNLDERYVLAVGRYSHQSQLAIFDTVERRQTSFASNPEFFFHTKNNYRLSWCYSEANRSVFVSELDRELLKIRGQGGEMADRASHIWQFSVDGKIGRRLQIHPEYSGLTIAPRADGKLVCIGRVASTPAIAIFDPETLTAELQTGLPEVLRGFYGPEIGFFSPDGQWALATHRKMFPDRPQSPLKGLLNVLSFPRGNRRPARVPVGRGVDLYRLDPFERIQEFVVRHDEVFEDKLPILEHLGSLESMEEFSEYLWSAKRVNGFSSEDSMERWLYHWIERVDWDDDSEGFTVVWRNESARKSRSGMVPDPDSAGGYRYVEHKYHRHASINGTLDELRPVDEASSRYKSISPEAYRDINAYVRQRSTQVFECDDWSGQSVAAAFAQMRSRLEEEGLKKLIFGDQFALRIRIDKKRIGEKKFCETIRKLDADQVAIFLPELRALLMAYGRQAAALYEERSVSPKSGPSDHSPGALSETALTLAMLDDAGFDALREWVKIIDQEHDYFAARRVFPAMAKRTGFATPEALRFGIWFFLQQWQTVSYEKSWHGLFKEAPNVLNPAEFVAALLAEAEDVDTFCSDTSVEAGIENVMERLDKSLWGRSVYKQLDGILAEMDS